MRRPAGKPPTIAVTGMNARADNPGPGLAVARCLRESGRPLRIVGLGYDALDPGLYSDYCDAGYLLPYPGAGEEEVLARLEDIHAEEGLEVVIPCLDAELPIFIALAPRLAALGIRALLPSETQLAARDKSRLTELAEQAGVSVPETRRISDTSFFADAEAQGFPYPFFVKGPYYDAQRVYDAAEGEAAFRRLVAAWGTPILVQHCVVGEEVNLAALGDGEGGLIGAVMMKKRALTDKGKGWAGITVHDEGLLSLAQAVVKALSWRGPLEVEALRDREGRHHLIEINPRFPAWIYLSAAAGRNLPALLVAQLLNEPARELPPPPTGMMFIRAAHEIIVPLAAFESVMMTGRTPEASHD
ncbi:MAG: ATP-grasp domain-containing protein [Rhodocyclaceae bacterium]|nr:ATP-grasp domain-containing protein [Rhodocyclaceae bacterium]